MNPRNRFEVEGERMSRKLAVLRRAASLRIISAMLWLAGALRGLA